MANNLQNFDQLPDAAYVRVDTVAALYDTTPSTIWRWTRAGKLPAAHKLSDKITGWKVGELRRAMAAAESVAA